MKWENVSVFISSTFQDMHGERDYLVKEVFPELLSWCESRRLHLYDIDLRWGISSEDSQNNNTVAACMHNIDRCRPFFVCFLAQRRGWVPGQQDINRSTLQEYPNLPEHLGKHSITEMEIEHALLSPMSRMYEGALHHQEPCKRALFFFRTESYLDNLPASERSVFLDSPENLNAADQFKTVIRNGGYPVAEYDCRYEPQPDGHGHLDHFTVGGETLGQVILRELKKQIAEEFPDHVYAEESPDHTDHMHAEEGEELAGIQEEFIWREEQSYYPQKEDLAGLNRYLNSEDQQTLCVTGKSGSGKTSLLCALSREYRGESRFIPRFCGISPKTSDLYSILAGILEECGLPVPVMEQDLYARLEGLLERVAAQGNTILLIDALNQARDGMHLLEILPAVLPEGLKIITSCKEESLTDDFLAKINTYGGVRFWHLKTVCDAQFKRGVIERFLSLYLKKLDENDIKLITDNAATDTPLHLSVILSELRVFGNFMEIRDQIQRLSGNLDEAFAEILTRLEKESDLVGDTPLARAVFGMLACSRNGLSEDELISAICILTKTRDEATELSGEALWPGVSGEAIRPGLSGEAIRPGLSGEAIRPALRVLLRQVRPFLARRGQVYDFFHESFRNAATAAAAVQSRQFHEALADAFYLLADPSGDHTWACRSARPLTEYPYHLAMAGRENALKELVMDPQWMENKMKSAGMQTLLRDYEYTTGNSACSLTSGALRLSAPILKQDPSQLAVQLEARLFSGKEKDPEIRALFEKLENRQQHYWLRPVNKAFVSSGRAELSFRHGEYAVTALCVHLDDLVVTDEMNRLGIYNRQTGERKNLIHVKGAVICRLVSDGRLLYAGCKDGTVSVWQTQSGTCVRTFQLTDCAMNDLKIFGTLLYAADESGRAVAYDYVEDRPVRAVKAGKDPLLAVAADGNRICLGSMDQKVSLFEGDKKNIWKVKSGYIGNIVQSGDHLVYTTFYPRIAFRNLKDGTLRTTDYTDGYDFNDADSSVIAEWQKRGPYIRDLVCLGQDIAVATPFSIAVFPTEGAEKPSETYPCQDARALAAFGDMVYAGSGNGEICSFQTGLSEYQSSAGTVTRIVTIACEGNLLAVEHDTAVQLFETQPGHDDLKMTPLGEEMHVETPGYFTDIVPWKGGFAVSTHCELTLWKKPQAEKWQLLHQSLKMEATTEVATPEGTRKMIALPDHLVFLTRGQELRIKQCKGEPEPGKTNAEMRKYLHISEEGQKDRIEAIARCSDTVFAVADRNAAQIVTFKCDDNGTFIQDRFPDEHRTRLMAASPDGMLYTIGEDDCMTCVNPFTGDLPKTGRALEIRLPRKALALAAGNDRIYVSLAGGWLVVYDRKAGEPCCSFQADSDINALYIRDELLFAGTQTGRFMAFREEHTEDMRPCLIPGPAGEEESEISAGPRKSGPIRRFERRQQEPEPIEDRKPEPTIRIVPPDQDSLVSQRIRVGFALTPVVLTLLAILIRGGLPGIWRAFTLGLPGAGGKIGGLILTAFLVVIELVGIMALAISGEVYYSETRRWIGSSKLPVLDRYILPVVFLIYAVPCLMLTRQSEGFPAAYMLSLFLPFVLFLLYCPILSLLQTLGKTGMFSRDKSYIGLKEAFFRLRVVVIVLQFIVVAVLVWAVNTHPIWFHHLFWKG